MNCAFHTRNVATVQCNRCARGLCPACDHRIRGFPYCQDCIVTGVETLQLREHSRSSLAPIVRRNTSPLVAILLSFIPGMGAAYNGQTSKAIVHFAVFASFFQMANMTGGEPFFVLGVFGTWLFSAVDACRTAQLIRAGLAPDAEEDVIMRRLYGNPLAWSVIMVVLGVIFLLHMVFGFTLAVRELLPVALVALGVFMLVDYLRRRRKIDRAETAQGYGAFDTNHPPPSVVTGSLDAQKFRAGDFVKQVGGRDIEALPFKSQS